MFPRHKKTARLDASGRGEVYLTEDTERDMVDRDLETGDRGVAPPASPSGTWSSKGWGIVAALIITLIVLGAALAIILKVGRGPEAGDRSDGLPTLAAASFEHLIDTELDHNSQTTRARPSIHQTPSLEEPIASKEHKNRSNR
jgi:hypothetical protein